MTRFVLAALLAAALGPVAGAQPAPGTSPPPAPTAISPPVYVPPGPAIPLHKSGGYVVGTHGYYPYDTGEWLLGGTDGLTRYGGSFSMVSPSAPMAPPSPGHFGGKHGLFRR